MIYQDLVDGRARLDRLVGSLEHPPLPRRLTLAAAYHQALALDRHGDVDDTRRLAGVLTIMTADAAERRDDAAVTASAGELLAVLSDLADAGDEEMAAAINDLVAELEVPIIIRARSWTRWRRDH